MLEHAAARGFRTEALKHTRLRLGEGYAGQAALRRSPVRIPALSDAPDGLRRAPLLEAEGFAAYYGMPLIAKGRVKGVLEIFHRSPLEPDREWEEFLDNLAGQAALAIDAAELFMDLQRSNLDLTLAYDATIEGWSRALDLRDKETEGHTQRVTEMTESLARALGVEEETLIHVRRGALLHDIGKMGVPDATLLKPGPLTEEEWGFMRKHPTYAYEMLSPIAYLHPALDIPYCHHEKWDGTGYPRGRKGRKSPSPLGPSPSWTFGTPSGLIDRIVRDGQRRRCSNTSASKRASTLTRASWKHSFSCSRNRKGQARNQGPSSQFE